MTENTEKTTPKAPAKRGRPATANRPKAAPKSIQQKAEEAPKESGLTPIVPARSTLPKVEGFRWTLDSSTLTLHLHQPGNPYKGYTCGVEKNGGREALFAARDYLLSQKTGEEELLDLANKIVNVEEVTV